MRTFSNCRRKSLVILTAGALLGMAVAAQASPAYQGISLYPLAAPTGGTVGTIQGINDGQTFGSVQIGSNTLAAIWSGNGSLAVLQPSNLGYYSGSMVMSGAPGIQGGWAVNSDNSQNHAMLWTGAANTAIDLNPTNLYAYYNSQINAVSTGQQVGSGASISHGTHAVIWAGTTDSAIDVNPAGAAGSVLLGTDGINQVGYTTANVFYTGSNPPGLLQAGLWSGTADSYVNLTPPAASWSFRTLGAVGSSQAVAVFGRQQVGNAVVTVQDWHNPANITFVNHALLWTGTGSSAVDLNPADHNASWALATNGSLQVGYTVDYLADTDLTQAAVWQGTAASELNLQQFLPAGFQSSQAYSIDAAGDIFGVGLDNFGVYHALEWTPLPEPGQFGAISVVLVALLLTRIRHASQNHRVH